ncbi:MAG: YegS/Rv2252/BmrU family lipid kinase [Chitinivibrionales bacterium]
MHSKERIRSVTSVVLAAHVAKASGPRRTNASLMTLHGRPLIEFVIGALKDSKSVDRIVVIGPEVLDELYCRRFMDERIAANIAAVHDAITGGYTFGNHSNKPYIVLCSDSVFLSPSLIDSFVGRALKSDTDMVIPAIASRHRYCGFVAVEYRNSRYSGGLPILVKSGAFITYAILKIQTLRRDKPQLLGSNALMSTIISLHNRMRQSPPTESFLPVNKSGYCNVPTSTEALLYARKNLKPPVGNRFRSIKMIVNPHAGQGMQVPKLMQRILAIQQRTTDRYSSIEAYVDKIRLYLADFGLHPDVVFSTSPEDAMQKAHRFASQKVELVIAVGGDGTINSIANGLAQSNTAMAVIPVGTINLFAIQMGIPLSLRSSCQLIADGTVRAIDMGKAKNTFFTTVMGIGFDAKVIERADSRIKKILGATSFLASGIISAFTYPFNSIRISIDDDPRVHKGYLALVANGKYYGIHSVVSPDARVDDGRLDLALFKRKGLLQLIRYLWGLRRGTLVEYGEVEYHQFRRITVHGHHTPIHMDGEFFGNSPLTVENRPHSLHVIC